MKFQKVGKHLFERRYKNAQGDLQTRYYARFRCRLKKKPRVIALGSDDKKARDRLSELEYNNSKNYDFDLDRQRSIAPRDGKTAPFSFAEWADKYPAYARRRDGTPKRSLPTDMILIKHHLTPFFGRLLITEIERETLTRYVHHREEQTVIRCGNPSKKKVTRGTISNELSLLRRMLHIAEQESFRVKVPTFAGLIVRSDFGGRVLSDDEMKSALTIFAPWMQRLTRFAYETCLSEGDLIRLTESMIDEKIGVVRPKGGRTKTGVAQISPLTDAARGVLKEIRELRRAGAMVSHIKDLVFTHDDGSPITKGLINYQVERAVKSGIPKFRFHDLRHSTLTKWSREGVHVDVAMLAGGHSSVQMHQRYTHLQDADVAKAFGCGRNVVTQIVTRKRIARRK